MKVIESSNNPTVKLIKSLKQSKYRKDTGMYIIEGEKIIKEATEHFEPVYIIVAKSYSKSVDNADAIQVSDSIFESLCDTKTPQGILAVMKEPKQQAPVSNGLIVALENVQNPLNVGTIIRTADAFGAGGVVLSEGCADVYSPKVLRGTMGSVYHLPIIKTNDFYKDLVLLKEKGFTLICGDLQGTEMGHIDGENRVLVIGNEGNGISEQVRNLCHIQWKINMPGKAESLNASVATGIMLYNLIK